MKGSRNTLNGFNCATETGISLTGFIWVMEFYNFIFHGWKVIESKFGDMGKKICFLRIKRLKDQKLQKYQTIQKTDFDFSKIEH